jgi:CheY-like chemotaxis protein
MTTDTTPTVLVVEDNLLAQQVISLQLKHLDLTFDIVGSALTALSLLEQRSYQLVLLDCRLPDIDGLEFIQEVRSHYNKQYQNIIIVVVTADVINYTKERCILGGANAWLSKPFRLELLSEAISQWLG